MPCPHCNNRFGYKRSDTEIICKNCKRTILISTWGNIKKRERESYPTGSHGAKGREQRSYKTTGKTHESEHTVGYDVFGHSEKRGKSEWAKSIENQAPAYQEELISHRNHIGTSTHKNYRNTGESSHQYREYQRQALKEGRAGNAVQLNQEFYAHQPEFRSKDPIRAKNLTTADASFENMVSHFPPVPVKQDERWTSISVSEIEKAEMSLARFTARSGSYPSKAKELEAMKKFGIIPSHELTAKRGVSHTQALDQHGIPMDGNCLFHSIWHQLSEINFNIGFVTQEDLRRHAVGFLRVDQEINQLGIITHQYLADMSLAGTWGGELEIMALAYVWGTQITVEAPDYIITYNSTAQNSITIYYDGIGHYSIKPLIIKKQKK